MKPIYWSFLLSLGLVACSSDEKSEVDKIEPQVKFLSAINPPTRATDTNFETGDKIGVFAVEKTEDNPGGVLQVKNYADNMPYVYSGNYFMPEDEGITIPSHGSAVYYRAVYPYQTNCGNTYQFEIKSDQYTGRGYTESDLMTAETNATTEETPVLVFNHRLCNLVFNLNYAERPAGEEALYIKDIYGIVDVNLNDNSFRGNNNTLFNVRAASNGTNSYRVILPPQTIQKDQVFATLEVGEATYTFKAYEELVWKSGRQYEYTLNIAKDGSVTFTGTINPWATSDEAEEAPMSLFNAR